MRAKKISILIIITMLISGLFYYIWFYGIPIPVRIDTTAVEIKLADPYHFEERTVTIRGWYRIFIAELNSFRGTIQISGYSETYDEIWAFHTHEHMNDFNEGWMVHPQAHRPFRRRRRPPNYVPFVQVPSHLMSFEDFLPVDFGRVFYKGSFFSPSIMIFNVFGFEDNFVSFIHNPLIVLNAESREDAYDKVSQLNPISLYELRRSLAVD